MLLRPIQFCSSTQDFGSFIPTCKPQSTITTEHQQLCQQSTGSLLPPTSDYTPLRKGEVAACSKDTPAVCNICHWASVWASPHARDLIPASCGHTAFPQHVRQGHNLFLLMSPTRACHAGRPGLTWTAQGGSTAPMAQLWFKSQHQRPHNMPCHWVLL
jgi:hypothetical protein